MSSEPGGDSDIIANRDTESPEEIKPVPLEAQEVSAEPVPPGPSNGRPPDIPSSGTASPEPLLSKEDGPGDGDVKSPVILANPVFGEKVEARIELNDVSNDRVGVGKTEEVVQREVVENE